MFIMIIKNWIFLIFFSFLNLFFARSFIFEAKAQTPFKRGEKLLYRVYYDALLTGQVNAAVAELHITDEIKPIGNINTYHAIAKGRTINAFNYFYKVIDRFESYFNELDYLPVVSIRNAQESDYVRIQNTTFDQKNKKAYFHCKTKDKKLTIDLPYPVYDMISAFYYARTLPLHNMKENEEIAIPYLFEDSLHTTRIIFTGREKVKCLLGTFHCLKFKPTVLVGNVFADDLPLTIWITDDENLIPVKAETAILVGAVKMELYEYKNLMYPLTSKIK